MHLALLQKKWIFSLLTIVAVIAIACGDSATATPPPTATSTPASTVGPTEFERYMDAITPTFETASAERQILIEEIPAVGADSNIQDVLETFQRRTEIRGRLVESLKVVEPPAEAVSQHERFISISANVLTLEIRIVDLLQAAGPDFSVADDLAAHLELGVTPLNRIYEDIRVACEDIERLFAANGTVANLSCRT